MTNQTINTEKNASLNLEVKKHSFLSVIKTICKITIYAMIGVICLAALFVFFGPHGILS